MNFTTYKRLAIIFGLFSLFLVATDTNAEKMFRKSLWSFFDVTVEEGSEISVLAPSSMLDLAETGRKKFINSVEKGRDYLEVKMEESEGNISILYYVLSLITDFIKFLASYVIIFYPILLVLLYYLLSATIFKKNYDFE